MPGTVRITPGFASCHNFGAGAPAPFSELNQITKNSTVYNLSWAEPQAGSSTDYDLFLANSSFTAIDGQSTNTQNGNDDPSASTGDSSSEAGRAFDGDETWSTAVVRGC